MVFLYGNMRRIVAEFFPPRIAHIDIYRVTVTVHFPYPGNGNLPPFALIEVRNVKIGHPPVGILGPMELPQSVKGKKILRHLLSPFRFGPVRKRKHVGMRFEPVNIIDFGIRPLLMSRIESVLRRCLFYA